MASPITWRNVTQANFGASNRLAAQGAETFQRSLDRLGKQFVDFGEDRKQEATSTALNTISGAQSQEELDNLIASGQLSPEALQGQNIDINRISGALRNQEGVIRDKETKDYNYEQTLLGRADKVLTPDADNIITGIKNPTQATEAIKQLEELGLSADALSKYKKEAVNKGRSEEKYLQTQEQVKRDTEAYKNKKFLTNIALDKVADDETINKKFSSLLEERTEATEKQRAYDDLEWSTFSSDMAGFGTGAVTRNANTGEITVNPNKLVDPNLLPQVETAVAQYKSERPEVITKQAMELELAGAANIVEARPELRNKLDQRLKQFANNMELGEELSPEAKKDYLLELQTPTLDFNNKVLEENSNLELLKRQHPVEPVDEGVKKSITMEEVFGAIAIKEGSDDINNNLRTRLKDKDYSTVTYRGKEMEVPAWALQKTYEGLESEGIVDSEYFASGRYFEAAKELYLRYLKSEENFGIIQKAEKESKQAIQNAAGIRSEREKEIKNKYLRK